MMPRKGQHPRALEIYSARLRKCLQRGLRSHLNLVPFSTILRESIRIRRWRIMEQRRLTDRSADAQASDPIGIWIRYRSTGG
jgi:hypothetical protein